MKFLKRNKFSEFVASLFFWGVFKELYLSRIRTCFPFKFDFVAGHVK